MVITINNTEDFLRVLRENEEFRIAARRELLTDELLKMPLEFSKFRTHVDKQFDEVKEDIRVVGRDVDGLGDAFRREVRAQSSFRGAYAQRESVSGSLDIAAVFAGWLNIKRVKTNRVSRRTMLIWLENNIAIVESLQLRDRAWRAFLAPDLIAEVRELGSPEDSDPEFYIVVEASYTGETEDIQRATDHAKIVRAVTGLQAYPVVASVVLDDQMDAQTQSMLHEDVQQFFKANEEDSALWYRLDSTDLKPAEPW